MAICTINPANELPIEHYDTLSKATVYEKIEQGYAAFLSWRKKAILERCYLLLQLAQNMNKEEDALSNLMTQEMGKPLTQAKVEIKKCVSLCEYYAEYAASYLAERIIPTSMKYTGVYYEPLGVIFGIMPWNFPVWQVLRFAIPTIAAGNTVLVKPAPITTGTGIFIEQLFLKSGFPENLFQTIVIENDKVPFILGHQSIAGLSFTGSETTGRIVASLAASHLKKAVLELGGNDPYLVFADADIDKAVECIATARLNNAGQVCIAPKRIIVDAAIYSIFLNKMQSYILKYQTQNPLHPETLLGPMARGDLRSHLHDQVMRSVEKGAELLIGGHIPSEVGYYYPATLLTHVVPGMSAFDEELFGPVLSISIANNEQAMIDLANNSRFGLGAAIFTTNVLKGKKIAIQEIESGSCFINAAVASDPRVPFGGIKASGFGRELSKEGIHEFVNIKTVAIQ